MTSSAKAALSPPGGLFSRRRPSPWLLAASLLALVQAALLGGTALDKSETVDEPAYVGAAAIQLAHDDLRLNCEAPALPKWGIALGLLAVDESVRRVPYDVEKTRKQLLFDRPYDEMRRNLFAARVPTLLVVVLGGLLLWLAARRFGEGPALLTHGLWCLSPTVLGNGSLATLDGWAAAAGSGVLLAGMRLWERPTLARAAVLGAFLGLGAACKVTTLGVAPVVLVVVVLAARKGAPTAWSRRVLLLGLSSAGAAFVSLWACYDFSFGAVHLDNLCYTTWRYGAGVVRNVPAWQWIEGVLYQLEHGRYGHISYLFGEVSYGGWWWFYLACIAFKLSVGAQGLALLRAAALARSRPARAQLIVDGLLLAFPLLLLVVMSAGKAQNGVKYLLPAFPYVMLWTGQVVRDAARAFGVPGLILTVGLAAGGAISTLAVHPHHLMYFNAWAGGPEGGPRYLISGDDWGQDMRRLGEWLKDNHAPGERLFFQRYGGHPPAWGIRASAPPCRPVPGLYAIHAVEVHRPDWLEPGCLDWLTVAPPDLRLGYSIYLWRVDKKRVRRLVQARAEGAAPFVMTTGQPGVGPPMKKR